MIKTNCVNMVFFDTTPVCLLTKSKPSCAMCPNYKNSLEVRQPKETSGVAQNG
jgi:hypothetical protein